MTNNNESLIDYSNCLSYPLTKGKWTLIDVDDYEAVSARKWQARVFAKTCYAAATFIIGEARKMMQLHRILLNAPANMQVDHINHNGLDNRRSNLRIVTRSENQRNRRIVANKHGKKPSKYKGVWWYEDKRFPTSSCWMTCITVEGKRKCLGYFHSEEKAALAYNEAAKNLHGEFALLNEVIL